MAVDPVFALQVVLDLLLNVKAEYDAYKEGNEVVKGLKKNLWAFNEPLEEWKRNVNAETIRKNAECIFQIQDTFIKLDLWLREYEQSVKGTGRTILHIAKNVGRRFLGFETSMGEYMELVHKLHEEFRTLTSIRILGIDQTVQETKNILIKQDEKIIQLNKLLVEQRELIKNNKPADERIVQQIAQSLNESVEKVRSELQSSNKELWDAIDHKLDVLNGKLDQVQDTTSQMHKDVKEALRLLRLREIAPTDVTCHISDVGAQKFWGTYFPNLDKVPAYTFICALVTDQKLSDVVAAAIVHEIDGAVTEDSKISPSELNIWLGRESFEEKIMNAAVKHSLRFDFCVIGCGVMGRSIAAQLVQKGASVGIKGKDQNEGQTAWMSIRDLLKEQHQKGLLTADVVSSSMNRLTVVKSVDEAVSCRVVIEAIFEDKGAKQELFRDLLQAHKKSGSKAVLTSSSINFTINEIIPNAGHVVTCGLRFLMPVLFIPQVEVSGLEASTASSPPSKLQAMWGIFTDLGMEPFYLHTPPGFSATQRKYLQDLEVSKFMNQQKTGEQASGAVTIRGHDLQPGRQRGHK